MADDRASQLEHQSWMKVALALAEGATQLGEVPVGAVVVSGDQLVATGINLRETLNDPTEHAEMRAIRRASEILGRWRLTGCSLYVTLEPCIMCAGAIWQARLDQVIYGASDPKGGAMGSLYQVHADDRLNHRLPVVAGILEAASSDLLKNFFRRKR